MSDDTTPRLLARYGPYADLSVAAGYTVLVVALLFGVRGLPTAVRIPLALPLLLFAPGYAFITAVFPKVHISPGPTYQSEEISGPRFLFDGLMGFERLTLAVVTSAALVPMVVYAVTVVFGLTLGSVGVGIAVVTLACCGIAAKRREPDRQPPNRESRGRLVERIRTGLGIQTAVDVLPVLAAAVTLVLVATGGVIVIGESASQTANTELSLLTRNESGNLTATDYQQSFEPGDTAEYSVVIEQHHDTAREFAAVVMLERVSSDGRRTYVTSRTELDRFTTAVPPGERNVEQIRVSPPSMTGNTRLTVMLYEGRAPKTPTGISALRTVYIPVEITTPDGRPSNATQT